MKIFGHPYLTMIFHTVPTNGVKSFIQIDKNSRDLGVTLCIFIEAVLLRRSCPQLHRPYEIHADFHGEGSARGGSVSEIPGPEFRQRSTGRRFRDGCCTVDDFPCVCRCVGLLWSIFKILRKYPWFSHWSEGVGDMGNRNWATWWSLAVKTARHAKPLAHLICRSMLVWHLNMGLFLRRAYWRRFELHRVSVGHLGHSWWVCEGGEQC